MEIKKENINGDRVIVSPVGEIDFTNSQELKDSLLDLYEDGYTEITVDFSEVDSIDSSGLGKLLLFHKKLKEKDSKLNIQNIESEYISNMFEMIHLHKVIEIVD